MDLTPATRPVAAGVAGGARAVLSGEDAVVARVGGRAVRAAELVDHALAKYPDQIHAALDHLIDTIVVRMEADRLGMAVDPSAVDEELARREAELERRARLAGGAGATLESWLRAELRMTTATFREAERQRIAESWLHARVIRYHQLREDRARFRIILVESRELAGRILADLAAGADFGTLARQHSLHAAAEDGGLVPWLARSAMTPAVAEIVFRLRPGDVGPLGILRDGEGRLRYQIVKLVESAPGRDVPWSDARASVEAGLREAPVSEFEWLQWKLVRESLYDIDNRLSPGPTDPPPIR